MIELGFISIFKAIFLGIIEGLTEFIPVSSTAHLLITSRFIEFSADKNHFFEIGIQFGAIIAVIVFYRRKLWNVACNFAVKPASQKFIINLAAAFLPAAFIGLLLHDFIKSHLFSNKVIACALIGGGILMILVEKFCKSSKSSVILFENISHKTAFKIGLFQCLAMIPGVSRSGSTIIGAMFLGINRVAATEFSFFLAIPTISAACLFDFYKNFHLLNVADFWLLAAGLISSFISSILVIKWLLDYVASHNFVAFALYRIIMGLIVLTIFA